MATYLQIDGIPLDGPAWESDQLDQVLDRATTYGEPGFHVSGQAGDRPQPVVPGPKRLLVPQIIYADLDPDGDPHADVDDGLNRNIEAFKRLLRPRLNTPDGTFVLELHRDGRPTVTAPANVPSPFQTRIPGPGAAILMVDFYLPGGVWRETTDTSATSDPVTSGNTFDLAVPHPGDADQTEVTITLSGTATDVRLSNRTWSDGDTTRIDVAVDLSDGDVVIDTGRWTALQGATDVHGQVSGQTVGPLDVWLPLLAGVDNTIRIAPTGGTCTVTVAHKVAWG